MLFWNPMRLKDSFELFSTLIVNTPFSSEIAQFFSSILELISSTITYGIGSPEISFTKPVNDCPKRLVRVKTKKIYDFSDFRYSS